jgi:hypothetical protein
MKFLLTIYGDESSRADVSPEEMQKLVAEYFALDDAARAAGVYVESNGLHPTAAATTVRVRNGEQMLTDGPFAETKEQLGGYYLLDCRDMEEALEWAARIPENARTGTVEVRAVMDYDAAGSQEHARAEVAR